VAYRLWAGLVVPAPESVARFSGWSAIITRPGRGGNLSLHPKTDSGSIISKVHNKSKQNLQLFFRFSALIFQAGRPDNAVIDLIPTSICTLIRVYHIP
jgi:hypothetical protein